VLRCPRPGTALTHPPFPQRSRCDRRCRNLARHLSRTGACNPTGPTERTARRASWPLARSCSPRSLDPTRGLHGITSAQNERHAGAALLRCRCEKRWDAHGSRRFARALVAVRRRFGFELASSIVSPKLTAPFDSRRASSTTRSPPGLETKALHVGAVIVDEGVNAVLIGPNGRRQGHGSCATSPTRPRSEATPSASPWPATCSATSPRTSHRSRRSTPAVLR